MFHHSYNNTNIATISPQANGRRSGYKNLKYRSSNKGTHNETTIERDSRQKGDSKSFFLLRQEETSPCDFWRIQLPGPGDTDNQTDGHSPGPGDIPNHTHSTRPTWVNITYRPLKGCLSHRYDCPVKPGYSPPRNEKSGCWDPTVGVARLGTLLPGRLSPRAIDKGKQLRKKNTHFDRFWGKLLLPIFASSLHRQYLQFSGAKGKGLESLY